MKIIDLLNKIANGEEVPKRIKYGNVIYKKMDIDNYEGKDFDIKLFDYEFFEYNRLNDEVEILEEEKKIPEKLDNNIYVIDKNFNDSILQAINRINYKINEIIDYLKSKGE